MLWMNKNRNHDEMNKFMLYLDRNCSFHLWTFLLAICFKYTWQNLESIFVRRLHLSPTLHTPQLSHFHHSVCFLLSVYVSLCDMSRRRTWSILFRAMRKIQCTRYGITWSITWRFIRFVWAKVFIEDSPNDSNTTCKYTITQSD